MSKLHNKPVMAAIVILSSTTVMAITTGDLILASKSPSIWPPAILERPVMQKTFDSGNFKIHYDTVGANAVYRVDEDINPEDGVPDYINNMASFLEMARYTYLVELGFDMPPPDDGQGGDDRYDIFVSNIAGLTVPESESDYYQGREAYTSYSFIGKDLRTGNHPNDPLPFLKATCAHEYFHAVQMAYRAYSADETAWWYELTANWAEERVFDDLNEVYYYLGDYYNKTNYSIYLTGGAHMYGGWIFAEYLSQNYGNDLIKMIFDKMINFERSLDAIVTSLAEHDLKLNTEFAKFSCWNYFTEENSMPGFYEESQDFPATIPIVANHSAYPTGWIDGGRKIENLGSACIRFDNPGLNKGNLIVEFEGDPIHAEELCLAAVYSTGYVRLTTNPITAGNHIEMKVENFNSCEFAVLSINYAYQGASAHDSAGYRYYAILDTAHVDIEPDITQPEAFELIGNYPNPFNLSSNIIFYWNSDATDYTISIYDIMGREIEMFTGSPVVGLNRINWKAPENLASGAYFYKLVIGDINTSGRMLLLK